MSISMQVLETIFEVILQVRDYFYMTFLVDFEISFLKLKLFDKRFYIRNHFCWFFVSPLKLQTRFI
ncbi:unnamed protein product [Acanthoscelides obtectus]|uniref:Uncharacterized protein n=1 Tax=Acanthoscelides obtectus TaxID=200917 RepID=A0A9P0QB47_ACAOB|nr:unnamed protein product [Acanthoscelides obtectus]CAK1659915.1 hypothetical protein AOBTE_LOCUS21751 [Acanthoscelides obtectus]